MIQISNDTLTVQVLHPLRDRDRMGPRFCTGCYVYQIEKRNTGQLLSGPEYPSHTPSVINGQGLPEVFQHTLFTDPEESPETKMIIGVGSVQNRAGLRNIDSHFGCDVLRWCDWSVDQQPESLTMETRQQDGDRSLDVERRLEVSGETVQVSTLIRNCGLVGLPIRWFAHPFFPVPPDGRCLKLDRVISVPANPAYLIDQEGWLSMQSDYQWPEGHFLELEGVQGVRFQATQNHPLLSRVTLMGDFPLYKVAIWANDRTFSVEPFLSATLRPGEELGWSMTYGFEGEK